ncbi:Uncharacterized protein SCG7086_CV_00010 [Chlamydiales bacterium SCGC AG-110-P3]|nr:Uncharacterized protein SCG7086_CV_00010 [Chlamydiales bacterium SCGC AG-110-P3]
MERARMQFLLDWLASDERKPMIIRGARQVGKTWLVRQLAKLSGKMLIEFNLEKQPETADLFKSNDPSKWLLNVSAVVDQSVKPDETILFLDEIQASPELIAKLRWFYEDMPELPVVCAGSLLEFVLADHKFSMPVGRINYMHLEPLSFSEFLVAVGSEELGEFLYRFDLCSEIPQAIHQRLLERSKEYVIVGGMPAAVSSWIKTRSLQKVNQSHHELLATYRDDFAKYRGRIATDRLEETMVSTPRLLGKKFMYSQVNPSARSDTIKQALSLLNRARLCCKVASSSANGVPLGAELKDKYFKEIFLDVGLCSTVLGLDLNQIQTSEEINLINKGSIAEQVAGQLLRTIFQPYIEPTLYCWHRERKGSNAELDYVIQHRNLVVPVEVKAGSTGGLKSLHLFMRSKGLRLAVRVNSGLPGVNEVDVTDQTGKRVSYTLLSLPFYLLEQLPRLIETVLKE